ncbi:hypothetical protein QA243_000480 [Salmonella enterica]|nr:hypothetical protein [Salmonella enterica]
MANLKDRFFPDKYQNFSYIISLFTMQRMTFPFEQVSYIACRNPFAILK